MVPPSTAGTDGRQRHAEMSVPLQRPDTPISKHTCEEQSAGENSKPRDYPEACRSKPPYATAAASCGKRAKDAILA